MGNSAQQSGKVRFPSTIQNYKISLPAIPLLLFLLVPHTRQKLPRPISPLVHIAKIYMSVNSGWNPSLSGGPGTVFIWWIADDGKSGQVLRTNKLYTDPVNNLDYYEADSPLGLSTFGMSSLTGSNNPFQMVAFVAAQVVNEGGNIQSSAGSGSGSGSVTSVSANAQPDTPYSEEMMQGGGIVMPAPAVTAKPPALSQPAMSTNVGMVGWLLAIVQNNPIILAGVVGVIAVAAYFGWYKKKL